MSLCITNSLYSDYNLSIESWRLIVFYFRLSFGDNISITSNVSFLRLFRTKFLMSSIFYRSSWCLCLALSMSRMRSPTFYCNLTICYLFSWSRRLYFCSYFARMADYSFYFLYFLSRICILSRLSYKSMLFYLSFFVIWLFLTCIDDILPLFFCGFYKV